MLELLGLLMVLDCVCLILFKNPVHSIYVLILFVSKMSIYLILLGCEFLGLLLMLIYLGAIVVLFIFIIMMLNIKLLILSPILNNYLIISFICFLYIYPIFDFFFKIEVKYTLLKEENVLYLNYVEGFNLLISLGLILYSFFFVLLILVGFILFIAMLGALFLTFEKSSFFIKNQNLLLQIYKEYQLKKYQHKL